MVISGLIVGVLAMPLAGGLEGSYYSGDGRGFNLVYELAAGGSLRRTRSGCMGVYRVDTGTWRRAGESVVFEYLKGAKSARGDEEFVVVPALGTVVLVDPGVMGEVRAARRTGGSVKSFDVLRRGDYERWFSAPGLGWEYGAEVWSVALLG